MGALFLDTSNKENDDGTHASTYSVLLYVLYHKF